MKVILSQTVANVGKAGQVVTVADGYARNYLFPRGLATVAEKRQLAALQKREERLVAKEAANLSEASALGEKLNGSVVKIEGKVGQGTKLFGAITSQDIADAIQSQLGVALEKKQVVLHDPIKRLGKHPVALDLHRQVDTTISVHVFDPEAPQEEDAAPAEEAAAEETANA